MNNSQMISEVRAEEGEMKKPVIMWAVLQYDQLLLWTVRRTRREAINSIVSNYRAGTTWSSLRRRGHRVAKVEVREVEG